MAQVMKGEVRNAGFPTGCGEGLLNIRVPCSGVRIRKDKFGVTALLVQFQQSFSNNRLHWYSSISVSLGLRKVDQIQTEVHIRPTEL